MAELQLSKKVPKQLFVAGPPKIFFNVLAQSWHLLNKIAAFNLDSQELIFGQLWLAEIFWHNWNLCSSDLVFIWPLSPEAFHFNFLL
jgi:hypothetical protein